MIPNYQKIYSDLIDEKFPELKSECIYLLSKSDFSLIDVMKINNILSEDKEKEDIIFNQSHRAYDEKTIKFFLKYQTDHQLSNNKLAEHFKIGRNTIARWKKQFSEY